MMPNIETDVHPDRRGFFNELFKGRDYDLIFGSGPSSQFGTFLFRIRYGTCSSMILKVKLNKVSVVFEAYPDKLRIIKEERLSSYSIKWGDWFTKFRAIVENCISDAKAKTCWEWTK